jgi:hypothetical protein
MNNEQQSNKWLTKRLLKFVALISLAFGIVNLMACIHNYREGSFLWNGNITPVSPQTVEEMKGMIKSEVAGVIPAISVVLLINAFLLWASSSKMNPDVKS